MHHKRTSIKSELRLMDSAAKETNCARLSQRSSEMTLPSNRSRSNMERARSLNG